MRFCTLGSGSAGNSTLVVAGETRVLLDCGLSGRETIKRLQAVGEDPARLNAVVLTHEHGDHVRGLACPRQGSRYRGLRLNRDAGRL
jgi:phosphoribosyl 1,2-cyclic phosphodiesterase